jgi:hypothetical protein
MIARTATRLFLVPLLLLLSTACTTSGRGPKEAEVRGEVERLGELQPVDVAVAPVRDQTNAQRVPLEVFRSAFVESLIERRYSPLAPSYVDANWVEASFKGTPPPDALLVVAVTSWDPTHLLSTGKVYATADVVLFEGADTTGRVLWQRTVAEAVEMGDGRGTPPPPGRDLVPEAVRRFARSALEKLPLRDPVAAHAGRRAAE